MRRRRWLAAVLLGCALSAAGCGPDALAQVGPTLPDVTEDGRLEVSGRAVNVLDVPLERATVALTVLHVSGATYVETQALVTDGDDPLEPFETVAFRVESSVPLDEIRDWALSFEAP